MPEGALYWYGNECTDKSGGWSADGYVWAARTTEAGEKNADNMFIQYTTSTSESYCRILGVNSPINLSPFTKLCVDNITSGNSMATSLLVAEKKNKINDGNLHELYINSSVRTISEMDVSSITGEYYTLFFNTENRSRWSRIYAVWLE